MLRLKVIHVRKGPSTEAVLQALLNSSGTRENGLYFADNNFKCNLLNRKLILIKISLKFIS